MPERHRRHVHKEGRDAAGAYHSVAFPDFLDLLTQA
jgi:hypothetical protein